MEGKKLKPMSTGFCQGEVFYQCPYCKKTFGGYSIFFQKQDGKTPYCPHCEEEFDEEFR